MLQQMSGSCDHLAEIVGSHIGSHAHCDPGRPVHQQIGNRGRQYLRLSLATVVVTDQIYDVFVQRRGHIQCGCGESALGVPHGSGPIIGGAEVAVAVHHGQPQTEGLRHPHQCVVDGTIAVRMQPTHHLPHHASGLHVAAVWPQTHLGHLEQDPPLHRFEAVAGVGKRSGVDHRVGVLQE